MVLLIIIPIKWLFHWEYTLFSDKHIYYQCHTRGIFQLPVSIVRSLALFRTWDLQRSLGYEPVQSHSRLTFCQTVWVCKIGEIWRNMMKYDEPLDLGFGVYNWGYILFMWGHRLQHCQRRFCDQHWRGSMHSWDQLSNSAGSGNTVIYITSIIFYILIFILYQYHVLDFLSLGWFSQIYLIQGWWFQDDTKKAHRLQVVSGVLLIYGEIDTDFLSSGKNPVFQWGPLVFLTFKIYRNAIHLISFSII